MTAEILALLFVFYVFGLYIYRMFFDGLSHIPGPKLAAASLWYEFYYDVVLKGQYTFEIGRMHEKYGMECLTQTSGKSFSRFYSRANCQNQSLRNPHQ